MVKSWNLGCWLFQSNTKHQINLLKNIEITNKKATGRWKKDIVIAIRMAFLKFPNVLHKIGPHLLFYGKLSHLEQTTWQVHLRLLVGRVLQVQFVGVEFAPNLSRNSWKQLFPEVPVGHLPSNTISLVQTFIFPIHPKITNTSKISNNNNIQIMTIFW